jgi:hypothetical protein
MERTNPVGAVFGHVIVVEVSRSELPRVPDDLLSFLPAQREIVLPEIAFFAEVVRELRFRILKAKAAVEHPEQALERVQERVCRIGLGGVLDGDVRARPSSEQEEGMPESRDRAVERVSGVDQRDRLGRHPGLVAGKLHAPHGCEIARDLELCVQPVKSRGEATPRVRIARRARRPIERTQRGFELRSRIGFAVMRKKEPRAVDFAVEPAESVRAIVQ